MKVNNNKPLLLIFPFDLLSHYLRCLMLARHFSNYFEIRFAHSEKYAGFVEQEGYQTFTCQSIDTGKVLECVKHFDFSWINERALESVYLDQVKNIESLKPAAVLGDTSLTLKMAAEKTGVTYISVMNAYMSKYYSFTRTISRTHPVYNFINMLPAQVIEHVTQKGEAMAFYKVHRPFKRIRTKYKLSKKSFYLDELEGDVNLLCDLVELFPQKNLPENYLMICPLYYDTDIVYTQIGQRLDKKKKTIFVSMGSTGEWENVAFLNNAHFAKYNIIAAGEDSGVMNADHIIKTPFINVREIFPSTDLVICQGGNGTIYQSLLYGIPLLCKTNHFEQEWNVEALERLGIGKSLDDVIRTGDYIDLVDEWIAKKQSGLNRHLMYVMQDEAAKLGAVVQKLAGMMTSAEAGAVQHAS